jgi:hypothetical protein
VPEGKYDFVKYVSNVLAIKRQNRASSTCITGPIRDPFSRAGTTNFIQVELSRTQ